VGNTGDMVDDVAEAHMKPEIPDPYHILKILFAVFIILVIVIMAGFVLSVI
jgi:hypothetical protein